MNKDGKESVASSRKSSVSSIGSSILSYALSPFKSKDVDNATILSAVEEDEEDEEENLEGLDFKTKRTLLELRRLRECTKAEKTDFWKNRALNFSQVPLPSLKVEHDAAPIVKPESTIVHYDLTEEDIAFRKQNESLLKLIGNRPAKEIPDQNVIKVLKLDPLVLKAARVDKKRKMNELPSIVDSQGTRHYIPPSPDNDEGLFPTYFHNRIFIAPSRKSRNRSEGLQNNYSNSSNGSYFEDSEQQRRTNCNHVDNDNANDDNDDDSFVRRSNILDIIQSIDADD